MKFHNAWLKFEGNSLRYLRRYKEGRALLMMEDRENMVFLHLSKEVLGSLEKAILRSRKTGGFEFPRSAGNGQITANNIGCSFAGRLLYLDNLQDEDPTPKSSIWIQFRPGRDADPDLEIELSRPQIKNLHRYLEKFIH